MLSVSLIVGKGKVSSLPVPSSLGALFRRLPTPYNPLFSFVRCPECRPNETRTDGTKAML